MKDNIIIFGRRSDNTRHVDKISIFRFVKNVKLKKKNK